MEHLDKLKFSLIHNQTKKKIIYEGKVYDIYDKLRFIDDRYILNCKLEDVLNAKTFKLITYTEWKY